MSDFGFGWGLIAFVYGVGVLAIVSVIVGGIGLFLWWLDIWWITASVTALVVGVFSVALWQHWREERRWRS